MATKKDMLSAALTCHAFLEPGLDEIWGFIIPFRPLISCLPEDTWEIQEEMMPQDSVRLDVVVRTAFLTSIFELINKPALATHYRQGTYAGRSQEISRVLFSPYSLCELTNTI